MNVQDTKGRTALIMAQDSGRLELVRTLLAGGAKVNAQMQDGTTALMRSARSNRAEVVAALLEAGADQGLTDEAGHNALWHARESARQGLRRNSIKAPTEREAEEKKIIRLLEAGGTRTNSNANPS